MTLVILGNDGKPARHVRINAGWLALCALACAGLLSLAVWAGWQVGELTALL
jgi:hypothetical protein